MRILLTTDTIGGVWTFTRELSTHLLASGHVVGLVSFGRVPSATQQAWANAVEQQFGAERFVFCATEAPLEWMQDNERTWTAGAPVLQEFATHFAPDVLHSNQFCWAALPLGVPTVVTAHSDVLSWAAATQAEGKLPASAWLERYCELVQRGLDAAWAVTAPTAAMAAALRAHFHVPSAVDYIANGRTLPAGEVAGERALQAVCVGRLWDTGKGLDTLLTVDSPMPVLVAGERQFENASARMAAFLQPVGELAEERVLDLFRSSAVCIAPSRYEPFGLAPLEAAMCGCALVLRDLPSFREIWGKAALYFASAEELEQHLHSLAADPARLRFAQTMAQRRAAHFSAERMTAHYVALYAKLVAGTHRTAGMAGASASADPLARSAKEFAHHAA